MGIHMGGERGRRRWHGWERPGLLCSLPGGPNATPIRLYAPAPTLWLSRERLRARDKDADETHNVSVGITEPHGAAKGVALRSAADVLSPAAPSRDGCNQRSCGLPVGCPVPHRSWCDSGATEEAVVVGAGRGVPASVDSPDMFQSLPPPLTRARYG